METEADNNNNNNNNSKSSSSKEGEEVPPQTLQELVAKKKKNKEEQKLLESIVSIGGIIPFDQEGQRKHKKLYSVNVQYTLNGEPPTKEGKPRVHSKRVKFGKISDRELEFVHHQSEYKKQIFLNRVNKNISPLSPKWWRIYILNNLPNIQSSYNDACERLCKDFKLYSSTTIYGQKY